MLNKNLIIIICILASGNSIAQDHDYLFPVNPGKINQLSGTVGELRSTHFHTGLDISSMEGNPVYAAKDGYVSRISVGPGGYGHALYLRHPDGNTTVYGHLLKFNEEIAAYVLKEQYRTERFSINRYPSKTKFIVKKGDIIAYSGNTGSSQGAHLHWDLRDAYQRPINSMYMGWKEIRDTSPPVLLKVAFRTLDIDSRVNGLFGRYEFRVFKKGDTYYLNNPISLKGKIGVEILGYDKLDDSRYKCGISDFELFLDDNKIFKGQIHKLSFSKQRSIYAFYNYTARIESGERFHKLYIDSGNDLDFYPNPDLDGILEINEASESIRAEFKDPYGNSTYLSVDLSNEPYDLSVEKSLPGISIHQNIMSFTGLKAHNDRQASLFIYTNGTVLEKKPYYEEGTIALYLFDMNKGIPDSLVYHSMTYIPHINARVPYRKDYQYYDENLELKFPAEALVEDLYLSTQYFLDEEGNELFKIGSTSDPLRKAISVTLKPKKEYKGKGWGVYSTDLNGNYYYQGGLWKDGNVSFSTSYFGIFTFLKDDQPPEVTPIRMNSKEVVFRIEDNLSGIRNYSLKVNGKWILMHFDPKRSRIWSVLAESGQTLSGELVLSVRDKAGNSKTYTTKIN